MPHQSYIGRYAQYKGTPVLVVRQTGGLVHINAPEFKQLQVSVANLKFLNCPLATEVCVKGKAFLVTKQGIIFSQTTGKIMQWQDTATMRKEILAAATPQPQPSLI